MIPEPQVSAHNIGDAGCYFLSILYLAEKITGRKIDIVAEYNAACDLKQIRADCFVLAPADILSCLTGERWTMEKTVASYIPTPDELEILRYEYTPRPMLTLGHFVVGNGRGGIAFDSMSALSKSPVVLSGQLVSKRIFRRAK